MVNTKLHERTLKINRNAIAISIMAVMYIFCCSVYAMSVTPVALELTSSGSNRIGQITVANDSGKALPVEIVISHIELGERGEVTSTPSTDEFTIFPPQALLSPGATQNFRIQWVGNPSINQSQSYIFSVNQVPVRIPQGKSGVQVVFNFATIVNVAPTQGRANINLVSSGIGKDEKGRFHPEVTVQNTGNMHAKLTDATIRLSGGIWTETLSPDRLRQLIGVGLVQPGKTRRFLLPVELPSEVNQVTANIDYRTAN